MNEASHHMHDHGTHSGNGDVGVHGMLLFGAENVYLSHLPMFQPPHEYQVLLRVTLSKDGSDAKALYVEDRKTAGDTIYTLVPEKFAMADLISSDEASALRSFTGTIFRGHFERGGTPLVEDVLVKVEEIVYAAKLDPQDERGSLTYLCFGKPGELFAVHQIRKQPDFDQVIAVKLADQEVADFSFARAAPVHIADRENDSGQRLKPSDRAPGDFFQSIGPGGRHGFRTNLDVDSELYFETGDLS
jgi:hypothetical protein